MKKEKLFKIIDVIILIIVATLCGIFTCLDFFDIKEVDYSLITATLLFAIALHFIFSAFNEIDYTRKQEEIADKIDSSAKKIINSLKGVEIKLFEKIEEVDLYVAEKILEAKKSVYDLNWQDYLKSNPNPRNPVDREYTENEIDKSIRTFCSEKGSRIYREIFTFSYPRNFKKMQTHITYGDNYSCSYYDNIKQSKFPKLQFVIIDDEEVIFVSSAYRPNFCAIRDKKIVSIFNNYFDQAWNLSQVIKERENINNELIDKIESKYVKS